MNGWEQLLYSTVAPDGDFGSTLSSVLDDLNLPVTEFSSRSGISESLLYKITSGHRTNVQLSSFKEIVRAVKRIEQGREKDERAVALITNRGSLEHVPERMHVDGIDLEIREYPSSTVEEAIRQSILAERDGVDAIICGPITAYTIENIVYTPVIGLDVTTEQVEDAIVTAVEKTTGTRTHA